MPLEQAEALISAHFPGVNHTYLKALIIAAGSAESANGPIPMLWATGPTEAAKTTTINIVLEMYGEMFQNLSGVSEERLPQTVGDALHLSRFIVFDDFAKDPTEFRRLHTFVIRLTRAGFTHYKNYVGAETPPVNNALIFTDWRIPAFFLNDPQFNRRVHLLRLDNRLAVGWDKIGHMVEGWWRSTPELTQAAYALHSWVIDMYFPPGDTEFFDKKMERLGIQKLAVESSTSDTQEAVKELVVELIGKIASCPAADPITQRRVGRGSRYIDWNTANTVGPTCALLIDSLGKGSGHARGARDDKGVYNADNLKHVLDPFQLHLPTMYAFKEGVAAVEFEIRTWGESSYVRLIESGRAKRSKTRAINEELFSEWPPKLLAPLVERPVEPVPETKVGEPVVETGSVTLAPFVEDDQEPIVIVDDEPLDPWIVHIDFETQSACDLKQCGSYVYAQHPSTGVMCAAIIATRGAEQRRIFWTLKQYTLAMPEGVEYEHGRDFLHDMVTGPEGAVLVAHNVDFERPIWVYTLGLPEPLAWRDTMDTALSKGLPGGADEAGAAICGIRKDYEGGNFLKTIYKPDKTGELPVVTDAVMQKLVNYNLRDVEIGYGITKRFGLDMAPEWEQRVCDLHHKINHWGIHIDSSFARTLREFDEGFKAIAGARVEKLTEGAIKAEDLTRRDFVRQALNAQLPPSLQLPNMQQATLEELLDGYDEGVVECGEEVIDVIRCYMTVSRAALAKVSRALDCISSDGRAKGLLRYYGAGTGRWSSQLLQIQNMKRPSELFDLEAATTAIENHDLARLTELCKDEPPYELLGSLIRAILVPSPGSVYVVGDFASVEARGLLWLAGDEEGLDEYRRKDAADEAHPDGKDPTVPDTYQTLAGDSIFGKDPVTVTKKERGGGKIGILACGFGGGDNAVERMARPLGVDLAAIGKTPRDIVTAFRTKYRKVPLLWRNVQVAFEKAITNRRTSTHKVEGCPHLTFVKHSDRVEMVLPSGRPITYMNARMEVDPRDEFGRRAICYDKALRKKTVRCFTHGAKVVENADQGFCRDLLADVMLRCDDAGALIPFHVHDEVPLEVPEQFAEQWRLWLQREMRTAPSWAPGMPVFSIPTILRRYGK
jgi:DNA polymerase